jgi:hypothetical protein
MERSLPFSRSLLYPLTALLVALAVTPVALVGYKVVTSNRDQVATLEKLYLTRQAVGLARELHLTFRDSLARIDTVAQALRSADSRQLEPETAKSILAEVVRGNANIIRLSVLDVRGEGPYVQARELNISAERALDQALGDAFAGNQRGFPVRRDFLRLDGEPPVAIVSIPLTGSGGNVRGALQAVVSLAWVAETLADESSRGAMVDVVDQSGEVLFSSDARREGASAGGPVHPGAGARHQDVRRSVAAHRG